MCKNMLSAAYSISCSRHVIQKFESFHFDCVVKCVSSWPAFQCNAGEGEALPEQPALEKSLQHLALSKLSYKENYGKGPVQIKSLFSGS